MSTRSLVAFQEGDTWRGVYVHWDGYPTERGLELVQMYLKFNADLVAMKKFLLEEHPGGFSHLTGDISKKPHLEDRDALRGLSAEAYILAQHAAPLPCYCHYKGGRKVKDCPNAITTREGDTFDAEWAYVFGSRVGVDGKEHHSLTIEKRVWPGHGDGWWVVVETLSLEPSALDWDTLAETMQAVEDKGYAINKAVYEQGKGQDHADN